MAVTPSTVTSGMGSGSATSYTTASVTPGLRKLLTLAVYNRRSGATGTLPSVSGLSATWTQVVTQLHVIGDNSRFTIFRCVLTASATGTLSIDFGGITQQMCHWHLVEWDGADITGTNGSNGIPQSIGVQNNDSTTSMTGTLSSSITKNGNATYGGMGLVDVIGSGITPGDSETELIDQSNSGSGFNWRSQFQWKQGTDNAMSWTYPSGGNQPTGAVIEVAQAKPFTKGVL